MHKAQVTVIADSLSKAGIHLTTFQCRYWRGVHSEVMTHRNLSKCAGSSRARPSAAIIEQVRNDPWGPLHWGLNEPGMQAHTEMSGDAKEEAMERWRYAAKQAADCAEGLLNQGAHKQVVNRILEPYTFIDVLITGTDFNNFFALRDHPAADPSIRDLAVAMKHAREQSVPTPLADFQWHMPYITPQDHVDAKDYLTKFFGFPPTSQQITELLLKISTARCARISYKAFDGKVASIEKDLVLYQQLIESTPMHATPAEHQAKPDLQIGPNYWANPALHGNFTGWMQYRKTLPNEHVPG